MNNKIKLIIIMAMFLIVLTAVEGRPNALLYDAAQLVMTFEDNQSIDTSKRNLNCGLNGSPSKDTDNFFIGNSSVLIDPDTEAVSCPGVLGRQNMTFSSWIRFDDIGGDIFFASQNDANGVPGLWTLKFDNGKFVRFSVNPDGLGARNVDTNATLGLETNTWFHTAAVMSIVGTTYNISLYVNGTLMHNLSGLAGNPSDINWSLTLGNDGGLITGLEGNMDDVYWWSEALDSVEIRQLYDLGNGNESLVPGNLSNVTATNLFGNTSIVNFNVRRFNTTFSENFTTNNAVIHFPARNGTYNLSFTSELFFDRTFRGINGINNFQGELFQGIAYFSAKRRGSNFSVNDFSIFFPNEDDSTVSNSSNSTGGLVLYLDAANYNISGKSSDFFDNVLEITVKNRTASRFEMLFYDINASISIFSNFNGSFITDFSISLNAVNSSFTENLVDKSTGNITFSLTNNTYDLIISASGFSPVAAQIVVLSNSTYPNFTFSLGAFNSVNFTLFDEITDTLIVKNATILLIGDTSSDNFTLQTGELFVQGLAAGEYRVNYVSNKYTKRDHYIQVINGTNSSVRLYLLSITNGTDVTFVVQDESGNKLQNATISLKRYFQSSNSYRTVAQARTNFEGRSIIDVDFNDAFYETFTTFGSFSLATVGTKIITITMILTLNLIPDPFAAVDVLSDITSSLSFNNNTQTFKYVFLSKSGVDREAKLEVRRTGGLNATLVCTATSISSGATLLCPVNTTATEGTYVASGFILAEGTFVMTATTSILTGIITQLSNIWKSQGIFFSIMVAGTMGLLGAIVSPSVGIIMFLGGLIVVNFMGLTVITTAIIASFILLGGIIIFRMKR